MRLMLNSCVATLTPKKRSELNPAEIVSVNAVDTFPLVGPGQGYGLS